MFKGFKTSEFVVTAVIIVADVAQHLADANILGGSGGEIAVAVAGLGYAVSRGIAKHGNVPGR